MAAELEKLRQDVRNLAKKFKDAGQDDLASLLAVDGQSLGAKAKIAKARGIITFAQDSHESADQAVDTRRQKVVEQDLYVIPEGTGIKFTRNIGGKPADQLEAEAKGVGYVSGYASDMLHNPKFTTLEEVTPQELIKLRVKDFGLPVTPTTTELFERIQHSRIGDMALELCRAEVGPHQRIADTEQPLNDWYYIAHEPIADRYGYPFVFLLGRDAGGLWLCGGWAEPGSRWGPVSQLVVALRKIEPVKA